MQLAALGITLAVAVVGGLITGYIIHIDCIFNILTDTELFDDAMFFAIDEEDDEMETSDKSPPKSTPINVATIDQAYNNNNLGGYVKNDVEY